MHRAGRAIRILALLVGSGVPVAALAAAGPERPALSDAQNLFYNGHYEAAAALALSLRASAGPDLANHELRASALLFQLKALLKADDDGKDEAFKRCGPCSALMTSFLTETGQGRGLARTMLAARPKDEAALFYLGKLDLNYVWLQLGLLGRKTGWDEYWEARHSLDAVLKLNPRHVRARVARAWIDYIVDTKMPWGTRWVLGGGNRKRALAAMRSAAASETDFFSHVEAEFALWDVQVRERDMAQAADVARRLARDFPENRELALFLGTNGRSSQR